MAIKIGDTVTCSEASIDTPGFGKGLVGKVTGFARLSSYHSREAMVRFGDGNSEWFWERDLLPSEAEAVAA